MIMNRGLVDEDLEAVNGPFFVLFRNFSLKTNKTTI